MKHIDTLRGKGFATGNAGKTPVEYELRIDQKQIPVGVGSIPGTKEIYGWVRPFCGPMGEVLNLELEDGHTMKFFFKDNQGSIVGSGGINPPVSVDKMTPKEREIALCTRFLMYPNKSSVFRSGMKASSKGAVAGALFSLDISLFEGLIDEYQEIKQGACQ